MVEFACMALWVWYFLNEVAKMMEPWPAQDEWEEEKKRKYGEDADVAIPHNSVRRWAGVCMAVHKSTLC